jgi:hypothetical protein
MFTSGSGIERQPDKVSLTGERAARTLLCPRLLSAMLRGDGM